LSNNDTLRVDDQDQLFDIVDGNDHVIGQEKRGIVHAQGLIHRAIHILIFNQVGEVFLQRRSPQKDTFPNCWDSSCSGHVDSGESYDTAAIRELGEELGITNLPANFLQPLFKMEASPETGQEFIQVYQGRHEGPFQLHPSEISEGRFFKISELEELLDRNPAEFALAFQYLWPLYANAKSSSIAT
jgi:isopentenyl-diphosphate delta-isomerase